MKKFLIKLSVFTCICLAIAYALQWMIDTGLKKTNVSTEYKEWYEITKSKINADIIIMGSSKAKRQISPKEFEQAFKLSTYNLGMDGQNFPMQKWRFDVYLKYNKKPKYVIQIVSPQELINDLIYYNYTQFIPYLNEGYIKRFGRHSLLNYRDFYIPLYKYCHETGMMEAGLTGFFKKPVNDNNKYKGFLSVSTRWNDSVLTLIKKQNPHGKKAHIDPHAYSDFIDLIRTCKKEKIDLILVCCPTPASFQDVIVNRDTIMKTYQDLSNKFGLKYLNYLKDPICNDTAMFYNFNHLNTHGVAVFNKQLISDLKGEIR